MLIELVRDQLAQNYRESDLKSEGVRIFTTLSPVEQEKAQSREYRREHLQKAGMPAGLQGVWCWPISRVARQAPGGRSPCGPEGFNRALNARRQVGSVIKPLVYLLALEHLNATAS
jgi:penicillin-binding protein 1B